MFASATNPGFTQPLHQQRTLLWCVLASIALHALALLGLSPYGAPAPPAKTLQVLTATLARVATSPREASPQSAPPEPPKPAPPPTPVLSKPVASPAPIVKKAAPAESVKPTQADPVTAPAAAPSPAVPDAQPASTATAKSTPQAPAGATTETTARSGSEADRGTLERYRLALIVATRRYKRYPAIALEKGWQGRVEVHLEIDAKGMLAGASIKTSSGHEVLDNQALDMLRKGKTTVQVPASLRGKEFTVDVPVIFNLDSPNS